MKKLMWLRLSIMAVVVFVVSVITDQSLLAAPTTDSRGQRAALEAKSHQVGNLSMADAPSVYATATPRPRPRTTATPRPRPRATPTPSRRMTGTPTAEPLFYNLPQAVLRNATGLYASPNRSELIISVSIPAGETVFVMGKNATSSHLRVVWNTGVGWIPVSFTDYNGKPQKLAPLPVFEREPPACAVPLSTQFGLRSQWTSDRRQKIAVIVDLFRSRYGAFPKSYLSLRVNGVVVDSSRRTIVERGQFSLKDVVFTVPQDLQEGDTVGYHLETSSDEPLTFMATIFSVPRNCQWDFD